jgi:hypothetical protein
MANIDCAARLNCIDNEFILNAPPTWPWDVLPVDAICLSPATHSVHMHDEVGAAITRLADPAWQGIKLRGRSQNAPYAQ